MTQFGAYKHGLCDALMGRECNAPKDWRVAPSYIQGFNAGKETGVVFFAAKESS